MNISMSELTILDADIDVEFKFYKATRGARDSFMGKAGAGAQLEPDEPADIEIQSVKFNGVEVDVSDKSIMEIEEAILESMGERWDSSQITLMR